MTNLFRDTYVPVPLRDRIGRKLRAFIGHPAVMFGEVVLLAGSIAAVIYLLAVNGWFQP